MGRDGRYVLVGATGQPDFDLARTFDLPVTPRHAELDLLDACGSSCVRP